jgi:putative membrane protein
MMLLHAGAALAPHDLWRAWSFEPGVIAPLAVTGFVYARGVRKSLSRAKRAKTAVTREVLFFALGFALLTIALISPIHSAGSVLFSAHMIQHEMLMAIAAPLLVLGRPAVPLVWGLPESMRRPVGRVFSQRRVRNVWLLFTLPLVAFLIHALAVWIWHAPGLYDASVRSEAVHSAQHFSFLASALLFWWSILQSRHRKGSEGFAILLLFLTAIHTTLLGALLTVSERPIYSAYRDVVTLPWGLTSLEDQQLGGIIMWVPGSIAYMIAALYLMLPLLTRSSTRVTAVARGAAAIVMLGLLGACTNHDEQWAAEMTRGNPESGKQAIRSYGCPACHTIPGIRATRGLVGPPLAGIASRSYIAGVLSNTPDHMIEWLRNPPGIDAKTAMPNMNVTERDARDIAAYLYTLR